jgi:TolB-like protein/Flp pilus assembly protein TadD
LVVLATALVALYFWRAGNTAGEPTATGPKSIAVLPFKPLVADSRNESLEIGMADTLITKLGGINQLIVRPISAVRKYTALDQDSVAAGRELGVDYVLEGNLQMVGEKTRATVRLLSVKDGFAIWTDKCDQQCATIFELQDAVAQQIAGALALRITGDQKKQLAKHYTENTEAYQLYLKGRYFWNKRTVDGLQEAVRYFGRAIEIDSNYALAYAGLADCYALLGNDGAISPDEGFVKAKAAATRALEIDDRLAEAHTSLAFAIAGYHQNESDAEPEFKRGLELNPNYATGHHWYALYLYQVGRRDEALSEMKRAKDLDPLSLVINAELGLAFVWVGQYENAIAQLQKTLEMDESFIRTHQILGKVYLHQKRYDEAIGECEKARQLNNDNQSLVQLGYAYAVSGRKSEAQSTLTRLIELWKQGRALPSDVAMVYTGLGDRDRAFEWLEKSYAKHENLSFLKIDPSFETLRSDPRYVSLLRRAGLAP